MALLRKIAWLRMRLVLSSGDAAGAASLRELPGRGASRFITTLIGVHWRAVRLASIFWPSLAIYLDPRSFRNSQLGYLLVFFVSVFIIVYHSVYHSGPQDSHIYRTGLILR